MANSPLAALLPGLLERAQVLVALFDHQDTLQSADPAF